MRELQCPKCEDRMVRGFIPDQTYGGVVVGSWQEGLPKKSFWSGTRLPEPGLPIGVFRSVGCGYLEQYADSKFAAD